MTLDHDVESRRAVLGVEDSSVRQQREMWGAYLPSFLSSPSLSPSPLLLSHIAPPTGRRANGVLSRTNVGLSQPPHHWRLRRPYGCPPPRRHWIPSQHRGPAIHRRVYRTEDARRQARI